MRFDVNLTEDAERDLEEIVAFIATQSGHLRAESVLTQFEEAFAQLRTFPGRGVPPPELEGMGLTSYKQVHLKPWRIIFQVERRAVHVMVIVDARRDLRAVLARRLLAGRGPLD